MMSGIKSEWQVNLDEKHHKCSFYCFHSSKFSVILDSQMEIL
jgi:hypothetical protein